MEIPKIKTQSSSNLSKLIILTSIYNPYIRRKSYSQSQNQNSVHNMQNIKYALPAF